MGARGSGRSLGLVVLVAAPAVSCGLRRGDTAHGEQAPSASRAGASPATQIEPEELERSTRTLPAAQGRILRGRVDVEGGLPSGAEARVVAMVTKGEEFDSLEACVAGDGTFSLELPEGAILVSFEIESPSLQFAGETDVGPLDVVLHADTLCVLEGRVRPSMIDGPSFPADAEREVSCGPVSFHWTGADLPFQSVWAGGELRDDGVYRVTRLPSGKPLTIRARVGQSVVLQDVEPLRPGEVRAMDLTLRHPATVRGIVRDERGDPVENATVRARGLQPQTAASRVESAAGTRQDGSFEIVGLAPGSWAVEARAVGLDLVRSEVALTENETRELHLELGRPACVRGEVRMPDGSPCTRAEVGEAWFPDGRIPEFFSNGCDAPRLHVDRLGRFALTVRTGRVQIVAACPGLAPSTPLLLDLAPGEECAGLVLDLRDSCRVRGRVIDPRGDPAPVCLTLACGDGTLFEFRSENDGSFDQGDLPPGAGHITVSRPWSGSTDVVLVPERTTEAEVRLH